MMCRDVLMTSHLDEGRIAFAQKYKHSTKLQRLRQKLEEHADSLGIDLFDA